MEDNDGRKVYGYLPEVIVSGANNPVIQVVDNTRDDILYTIRIQGNRFLPHVYGPGTYSIRVGRDRPDAWSTSNLRPDTKAEPLRVSIR